MKQRETSRALCAVIAACALSGCPAQHELQASDTATNWLAACTSDRDCHGAATCELRLCTLACPLAMPGDCRPIDPNAICQPGEDGGFRCDVSCSARSDCAGLGPEYACDDGHCRPAQPPTQGISKPQGGSQAPAQAPLSKEGFALETGSLLGVLSAVDSASFDPASTMLISDPRFQGNVPVVTWRDDHWNVAWTANGWSEGGTSGSTLFYVAAVSRGGQVERRASPFQDIWLSTLQEGRDGRVANLIPDYTWRSPFGTCRFQLLDTTGARDASPTGSFPCTGDFAMSAIDATEDWLVAWSAPTDVSAEPSDLMLARYRPSEARWVAGPWVVGASAPDEMLSLGSAGPNAWLAWGEGGHTMLRMVPGVAGGVPAAPGKLGEIERAIFLSTADGWATIASSGEDALLFIADEDRAALQALPLHADGTLGEDVTVASTLVYDRPVGVADIPEQELLAVCYADRGGLDIGIRHRVALVTVNYAGELVAGPLTLADGIENLGGCDVAWSGSELLVAWWDIAIDAPRSTPPSSTVRARMLPLP